MQPSKVSKSPLERGRSPEPFERDACGVRGIDLDLEQLHSNDMHMGAHT